MTRSVARGRIPAHSVAIPSLPASSVDGFAAAAPCHKTLSIVRQPRTYRFRGPMRLHQHGPWPAAAAGAQNAVRPAFLLTPNSPAPTSRRIPSNPKLVRSNPQSFPLWDRGVTSGSAALSRGQPNLDRNIRPLLPAYAYIHVSVAAPLARSLSRRISCPLASRLYKSNMSRFTLPHHSTSTSSNPSSIQARTSHCIYAPSSPSPYL